MKVFSDGTPGAYTTDIIAALGDCALLGVDAINMVLHQKAMEENLLMKSMIY